MFYLTNIFDDSLIFEKDLKASKKFGYASLEERNLLSEEEGVQTLVNLGLTVLQAKVYIALAKLGTSTGRTTAKTAKVASQDVYRVLSELQEKGLVEKIIDKPNKYRPIQIEEGLTILLQRRNKQTVEIKNMMTEIFKNFSGTDKIEDCDEKYQFVWVPHKETIENKFRNGIETAQTSVDLSCEFPCSMNAAERELNSILKSIKRDIKFRELIDLSQGICQEPKAFLTLKRNPAYQTRFICLTFPVKILIKDKREVFISIKNAKSNIDTPYLWSNNPILVQVIQQWYDIMWEKSSKEYQRVQ
jgi:sugar-specific transcriptional regulator TrmB